VQQGSKAALHAMTRGWAEELGPRGITVNVALLGPIETDLVFPEITLTRSGSAPIRPSSATVRPGRLPRRSPSLPAPVARLSRARCSISMAGSRMLEVE
jgi:NAD(P)-dependent dehydrogenase (short-subunit alcohol dehydrogenase family)